MTSAVDYQALAREFRRGIDQQFAVGPELVALVVAEESGEFVGAVRRWAGFARRQGSFDEMAAELADVVIAAYVAAEYLGIDLPAAVAAKAARIRDRGWREEV